MKISFEFGRRGRHSMAAQNRRLQQEKEALCLLLEQERRAHGETARQLVEALSARIENKRRGQMMGQGRTMVPGGQTHQVVRVHPEQREARFQLTEKAGELVVGGGRPGSR